MAMTKRPAKEWYYTYVLGFGFGGDLRFPYQRETWEQAMKEGLEHARKFRDKGMVVTVKVIDVRKDVWDYTYDLNDEDLKEVPE